LINNKTDILLNFIQEALLFQWFVFCDERISCAKRTVYKFCISKPHRCGDRPAENASSVSICLSRAFLAKLIVFMQRLAPERACCFRTTRPSSSCDAFEAAVVAAAASVAAAAAAAAAGAAAVGRKCSWAARPPRIDDASQSRCATTIICPPFPFQSFERFRPESVLANLLFAVFKRNGFRNGFLHTS
jgi:hypothetical protein